MVSAVNTARGGGNDLYIINPAQDLSSFSSIHLNQFTGGTNERLTPQLLMYMNNEIHNRLSENGVDLSKDGQLRISGASGKGNSRGNPDGYSKTSAKENNRGSEGIAVNIHKIFNRTKKQCR